MLTCRLDSRIFQGKTVQDLVGEVFAGFGSLAKCELRLNKSLKLYSYCNPPSDRTRHSTATNLVSLGCKAEPQQPASHEFGG